MKYKFGWFLSICAVCFIGCEAEVAQTVDANAAVSGSTEHAAMEFTSAGFQKEVLGNSQVVLVDFWGPG